jgi:hypothetical protein
MGHRTVLRIWQSRLAPAPLQKLRRWPGGLLLVGLIVSTKIGKWIPQSIGSIAVCRALRGGRGLPPDRQPHFV